MKLFVIITAWNSAGNKAFSVLTLDNDRNPCELATIYAGQCSQSQLLRQWLHHINGLLDDGEKAIVFSNHRAARTKSNHVADFAKINVVYSASYTRKYSAACGAAIDIIEKRGRTK